MATVVYLHVQLSQDCLIVILSRDFGYERLVIASASVFTMKKHSYNPDCACDRDYSCNEEPKA